MREFSNRPRKRNICNVLINVPLKGNFDTQNRFLSASLKNHITINTHTDDYTKKKNAKMACINLNNCIIPFEADKGSWSGTESDNDVEEEIKISEIFHTRHSLYILCWTW